MLEALRPILQALFVGVNWICGARAKRAAARQGLPCALQLQLQQGVRAYVGVLQELKL